MLCGTNLIELHHFAGMATKPLCLTSMNVMQGIDIRNPPLHSWIPTHNSFCSRDVLSLKSGDNRWYPYSRYSISSFGWRTPVTPTVVLICWLANLHPRQPGVLTERFPAFGFWAQKGLSKKWRKWRPQQVYPNTKVSVSHLPSLASVGPACSLGAHQTEFLDPTSKNRPTHVRVVFFHGIKWDLQIQIQVEGMKAKLMNLIHLLWNALGNVGKVPWSEDLQKGYTSRIYTHCDPMPMNVTLWVSFRW